MSVRASLMKRFDELDKYGYECAGSFSKFAPRTLGDDAKLARWQTACLHLIERTFGEESTYYKSLRQAFNYPNPNAHITHGIEIMRGAREEIEKGFLYKIEHLIAADMFDTVLEQAQYLLDAGLKDVAAILGRVVIERSLKEIAKRENIEFDEKVKLSTLNDIFFKKEVYAKNIWRINQGHIDVGNYAAHGDFDKYDEQAVKDMLKWTRETILNL